MALNTKKQISRQGGKSGQKNNIEPSHQEGNLKKNILFILSANVFWASYVPGPILGRV